MIQLAKIPDRTIPFLIKYKENMEGCIGALATEKDVVAWFSGINPYIKFHNNPVYQSSRLLILDQLKKFFEEQNITNEKVKLFIFLLSHYPALQTVKPFIYRIQDGDNIIAAVEGMQELSRLGKTNRRNFLVP